MERPKNNFQYRELNPKYPLTKSNKYYFNQPKTLPIYSPVEDLSPLGIHHYGFFTPEINTKKVKKSKLENISAPEKELTNIVQKFNRLWTKVQYLI